MDDELEETGVEIVVACFYAVMKLYKRVDKPKACSQRNVLQRSVKKRTNSVVKNAAQWKYTRLSSELKIIT
jgi:hypothetical protein